MRSLKSPTFTSFPQNSPTLTPRTTGARTSIGAREDIFDMLVIVFINQILGLYIIYAKKHQYPSSVQKTYLKMKTSCLKYVNCQKVVSFRILQKKLLPSGYFNDARTRELWRRRQRWPCPSLQGRPATIPGSHLGPALPPTWRQPLPCPTNLAPARRP